MLSLLVLVCALPARAQDGPPAFVRDAVDAVITFLQSAGDEAVEAFIAQAMLPDAARDRTVLADHLRALRTEVGSMTEDISVEADPEGLRILLSDGRAERQLALGVEPQGITELRLLPPAEALVLTRENLAETFDRLEDEGMAGVVSVRLGDEVLLERALGMADPVRGRANTLETVFGTGSRPIDYTVAAIHLLAQRGDLSLDDNIGTFFPDVPADKQAMTIRHLLTGQSGLPDFFDTEEDWDPDLAWVDRVEAEDRILTSELLFVPGTDRQHSHAAFGLLAAAIEHVAEMDYYAFLRRHFFDPAGMTRTGEYGEARGLSLEDFAVGGGPSKVGIPNIPPNWGPTSWLVKGSGGMYSTLGDLQRFYAYVRSGAVLDEAHSAPFRGPMVQLDGSDRGFELFSISLPTGAQAYVFMNHVPDQSAVRPVFRALERLLEPER